MKKIRKITGMVLVLTFMLLTGCGQNNNQVSDNGITDNEVADNQATGNEEQDNRDSTQDTAETYDELLEGDKAPDFTAETVDGSTFTLSEQGDKVVLLNFWATWCSPCVGEMPAFEKLYEEYGDKLSILAVNYMEDKDIVNQFVSDNAYTFPIGYDVEGEIVRKYPAGGIPYTLVIGKDGTIQRIYAGAADAETQYQEYKSAIDTVLENEK